MAEIVTRTCVDLTALTVGLKWGQYPRSLRLTFSTEPVSYETACAHLELFAPDGYIVMCKAARGPRGGLGPLRFVTAVQHLRYSSKRVTYHIAYKEAPHETE